jgi:hypothetical protein
MSLTSFASVLFEARVRILNDFAKPINMNKFTGYFSVSLHCFFRASYFFSLKNVGTSFLTVIVHLIEIKFHQPDTKIPFQKPKHQVAQ